MNWKNPFFNENLERSDKNLESFAKLFNLQN